MPKIIDTGKELIKLGAKVPLDLENIIIKIDSSISLDLIDWKKAGLKIVVSVDGVGYGHFNEKPYSDRETALREYQYVLTQVQNGNYLLELHRGNKLKLILTNSE